MTTAQDGGINLTASSTDKLTEYLKTNSFHIRTMGLSITYIDC